MSDLLRTLLPHTDGTVVEYCQSMPGALLAAGKCDEARQVVTALAHAAHDGYLPAALSPDARTPSPRQHDICASLWFIQTGYTYFTTTRDEATWRDLLLPRMKKISQAIISGAFENTRMGDGGLLDLGPDPDPVAFMTVNILWDSALALLAEELRRAGDSTGDHFERLGGRFKRSFLKTFWSDKSSCLRVPAPVDPCAVPGQPVPAPPREAPPEPAGPADPADPVQLLVTVLPASAVPRTKQRQIVDLFRQGSVGTHGVKIETSDGKNLYCPLYLAWLAEGHVRTSDTPATAVAEAQALLRPLQDIRAASGAVAKFYDAHGQPASHGACGPHGPSMGELQRVWLGLQETAERPIGNSKRTRITGTLMPGALPGASVGPEE